jgi:hypothetical protein
MHRMTILCTSLKGVDTGKVRWLIFVLPYHDWLFLIGIRLHKQSFQCTQYAHFNDCTNRR